MVYFADHPTLALLEVLVHLDLPPEDLPDDYVMLRAQLPGGALPPLEVLTADARVAGDRWLAERTSAVLRVPSAIVPQAANLLFNPSHPDAAGAAVVKVTPFRFDPRLWRGA